VSRVKLQELPVDNISKAAFDLPRPGSSSPTEQPPRQPIPKAASGKSSSFFTSLPRTDIMASDPHGMEQHPVQTERGNNAANPPQCQID
jgi:hypothetical protein